MSTFRFRTAALALLLPFAALPAMADGPVQTPSQAQMKATLRTYFDAMNATDTKNLKAMFSADSMVEDPVGTPLRSGDQFLDRLASAKLHFDIVMMTGTGANSAAAAVTLKSGNGGLSAIEVFTFKPDGKISSMKAYWGSEDRKN